MRRSSAHRGQLYPIPALVAVVVVCLGMSLYAGVLTDFLPTQQSENPDPTLQMLLSQVQTDGVVEPETVNQLEQVGPPGYETNVTLETADKQWTRGPALSAGAPTARERVSVRVAPGHIQPGWFTVRVNK